MQSWLVSGHAHTKEFNYELICLWYKISKLIQEASNSVLLFNKTKGDLKVVLIFQKRHLNVYL